MTPEQAKARQRQLELEIEAMGLPQSVAPAPPMLPQSVAPMGGIDGGPPAIRTDLLQDKYRPYEVLGNGMARGAAGLADLPFAMRNGLDSMFLNDAGQETADNAILGGNPITDAARAVVPGFDDRGNTSNEQLVGKIGEFMPGAMAFGGPTALGPYAAAPAAAMHYAGQATEGKSFPDWVPGLGGRDAQPWAETAAALAAPFGAIGAANIARTTITPNPGSPSRLESAKRLRAQGIPVTAGQATGSPALRLAEDTAPGLLGMFDDQIGKFTDVIMKRLGVTDEVIKKLGGSDKIANAGPKYLKAASEIIGKKFDDFVSGNNIPATQELLDKVKDARVQYQYLTAKNNVAPIVKGILSHVDDAVTTGRPITGKQYKEWRTTLSKASTGSDGPLRDYAKTTMDALDDAMERGLIASGQSTAQLEKYREARAQWGEFLAVVRAMKAGPLADQGLIDPSKFRSGISGQGGISYATNTRPVAELARDAANVTAQMPHSARQNLQLQTLLTGTKPAVGAGGLLYALTQNPQIASAGAVAAGTVAPIAKQAFIASKIGQKYLGNQLLTEPVRGSSGGPLGVLGTLLGNDRIR